MLTTTRPRTTPVPPPCPDRACHTDFHGRLWKDTTYLRNDPDNWRWYCPRCGQHWMPTHEQFAWFRTLPVS
ncbi:MULTISPECIES: hypothetical protein [Streptomyces]|uniref:Uncharacterized protein n=1 Tax=Streptomyces koyangensis TaxID=188770 RepID=A0A385DEP7_9ACTN|nr:MULTISPECIES: hypothetical protein [Streptomyces]KIX76622.1 hypothetical protein SF12_17875 [Streptomyces sp. MBRL 601]WTD03127.1 hypothetical protein OH717_11400 [Streptomyces albidoflavus]AXQ56858.1 hypothetical protein D0C37_21145 [Streptomyces koyangensis]PKR46685.1 hypothetical protein CWE27_03720 [Streptomyces sp. EAG2]RZE95747.1 hypothetical protein C0L86_19900 [Streptomyces sp. SCA2-2]